MDNTGLAQGAWTSDVYAALNELVQTHGINSPNYDPERPPLAAIDCDGTLIYNDIGEAMMRYMITRRKLSADRAFWNHVVPERMGRDALQAAYKAVAGRSDSEVHDTAAYRRYRAGMFGLYQQLLNDDMEEAYLFATKMLRGIHERTVADLVEEVLDYELDRPLSSEDIPSGPPFAGCVVSTGISVYNEMIDLLQVLEAYGFSTWIVTSSNAYVVKALARRAGFPEERVLGIELQTQGGRYTDRVNDPYPIGEGKLELFLDTVGRSPLLAIGDSLNDAPLLDNCEGLSIAIDNGDEAFLDQAREHGWLIQTQLTV